MDTDRAMKRTKRLIKMLKWGRIKHMEKLKGQVSCINGLYHFKEMM